MTQQSQKIKIGLIQAAGSADGEATLAKTLALIEKAALQGAKIISTQELFKTLYFCQTNNPEFFKLAEPIPGPTTNAFAKKAKELGVVIVASVYEKAENGDLFNTAVVFDADGTLLGQYRKVHIPDDPKNFYSEMFYFKPGDLGFKAFKTKFGNIGVLVCWDQWYPEAARATALKGADIIFYPTAIGWQIAQQDQNVGSAEFDAWTTIQRSHAIANGVFVAAVNRVQREDNINFWGGSFVCDPYGQVLTKGSHDKEEILLAECDLSVIDTYRKDWPFLTCRRKETYL